MSASVTPPVLPDHWQQLTFHNGAVPLHAVAAGPLDGPVALLLHGFPEFWYSWRNQLDAFASAGYRVIAPDGRGYNLSGKPARVSDYALPELVADVVAIVRACGSKPVFLVGHDWGAIVAWCVAAWHPELVHRLAILNVPHPATMRRFMLSHPKQLLKSWYMFAFQVPRLPERLFSARNFRTGTEALHKSSRAGTFSDSDLACYRHAWSQPGSVRSMIHWYRALFRHFLQLRVGSIEVPVRILWGRHDAFLLPGLATASLAFCRNAQLEWFDDATHWLHLEYSAEVNASLLDFFGNSQSPADLR